MVSWSGLRPPRLRDNDDSLVDLDAPPEDEGSSGPPPTLRQDSCVSAWLWRRAVAAAAASDRLLETPLLTPLVEW